MSVEAPSSLAPQKDIFIKTRDVLEKYSHGFFSAVGKIAHPNHISAMRLPGAAIASIVHTVSREIGVALFAVNTALDWCDGAVARATKGAETKEGALIDPLTDKAAHGINLGYLMTQIDNQLFTIVAGTSILLNALFQLQRGSPAKQWDMVKRGVLHPQDCEPVTDDAVVAGIKANTSGKVKQIIECASIGLAMAATQQEWAQYAAATGLLVSIGFNVKGAWERWKGTKATAKT